MNILDYEYLYNGGGAAISDFNNDGMQDIFFTGNMVNNKLYLNEGDWKFRDISIESNTEGKGKWSSGVSIIDINQDGMKDIYISCSTYEPEIKRENIFFCFATFWLRTKYLVFFLANRFFNLSISKSKLLRTFLGPNDLKKFRNLIIYVHVRHIFFCC